jgi:hypothetical protein
MLRAAVVVVLLLGALPVRAAGTPWVHPDEDDPKLARVPVVARSYWRPTRPVPRLTLSYRRLWAAGLEGGNQPFDVGEIDFYPVSNLIRFGIEGEFGWAGGNYRLWYAGTGVTLGMQWPARVTPFLVGRFLAGLVGGSFMGSAAVSWIYQGGIDTGVEVYYARRFYISAAIGWVHPVYGGVDVAALNANKVLIRKDFANDSFTFRVGLGL